jgi:hypothetical protein
VSADATADVKIAAMQTARRRHRPKTEMLKSEPSKKSTSRFSFSFLMACLRAQRRSRQYWDMLTIPQIASSFGA